MFISVCLNDPFGDILTKAENKWAAFDFLSFIVKWDFVDSLPIPTLSLRLFLTICVSVTSCEGDFSKLKLIKNYLRSTMGRSRLTDLAILAIESELAKDTDFDEVIRDFAEINVRHGGVKGVY